MPERLLIADANILIDMEAGALVDAMFRLAYQFAVPDVLFEEELRARHGHLQGRGLPALELSGDTMAHVFSLAREYGNCVSRNDLMALGLAMQERCTLLTGDRRLRQVAEERAVSVRGTLWLVEQMPHAGILSQEFATPLRVAAAGPGAPTSRSGATARTALEPQRNRGQKPGKTPISVRMPAAPRSARLRNRPGWRPTGRRAVVCPHSLDMRGNAWKHAGT